MAGSFVAVHTGAGCFSESSGRDLKMICTAACREAMRMLREGKNCRDVVALTISMLEDSPLTNAGLGSNLTLTGTVECDASIMDGQGGFGAVAAAPGLPNPILVAQQLLEQSSKGCLPLGRIPPLVLAGQGACLWAGQQGLSMCNPDDLITDHARQVYLDHKSRLDGLAQPLGKRRKLEFNSEEERPDMSERLDTVGAVCVDERGEVAAGVSSGGISLKFPGRVGQAATFGCGCWADGSHTSSSLAVACSTSGTGEYIIKTQLAKECAAAAADCNIHKVLNERFLCSKCLENVEFKFAGIIAVNVLSRGAVHFSWGHTTESMCMGYMGGCQKEPVAFVSRMSCADKIGRTAQVGGIRVDLPLATHQ